MRIPIKVKKLDEKAILPEHGSVNAAGYDLFACLEEEIEIKPHQTVKIPTGLAIAIPDGYWGGIFARSGLATKESLRPANCVGVIDSDYRGNIIVALHNDSNNLRIIKPNEKIAQLIIVPFVYLQFQESDYLDETMRGDGGFGSTGK